MLAFTREHARASILALNIAPTIQMLCSAVFPNGTERLQFDLLKDLRERELLTRETESN